MKVNSYVKKYIESKARINVEEDRLRNMAWGSNGICKLKVNPCHFNYFCFKATIGREETTITLNDAISLSAFLLKWSEGVDGEHEIIKEIIKREKEKE
jgi:hypothetical protein